MHEGNHMIELLEAPDFDVKVGGITFPLPDPRMMNFQDILVVLDCEDVLMFVTDSSIAEWKREKVFALWRGHWDLPTFRDAHHLAYLVDHYRSELTADLRRYENCDLLELWRGRRWQTLLDLIAALPQGSLSQSALSASEEHAKNVAAQMLDKEEADKKAGITRPDDEISPVGWSQEMYLLADIYDAISAVYHVNLAANSKDQPKPPEPHARPKSILEIEIEKQRFERRKKRHEALAARVIRKKG